MRMGLPRCGVRLVCLCWVVLCSGCGWIADKDRIKVAKLQDRYITRGDLFRVLREMPDDERPHIQGKGDLVRVLKNYVDDEMKRPLAAALEQEGKKLVTREQAQQRFFAMHPEDNYQLLFTVDDPQAFDMTQAEWEAAKVEAEMAIDRLEDKMRCDAAVAYRAMEAFQEGVLTVSEEDYQREYDFRKEELRKPEQIHFLAIRFKTSEPNAAGQAAQVRRRLAAGESFDDLVDEYLAKDKSYILDSDIAKNPKSTKFAGFWLNASGSQPGDIIGTVFLPAYELVGRNADGQMVLMRMPDAYLVLKVLEYAPERDLTLEEAKRQLLPGIVVRNMMERLREENKVEIYYDKLPDPAMLTRRTGDPIMGEK